MKKTSDPLIIRHIKRNWKAENDLRLVEKTNFCLQAGQPEDWAKVIPGRPDGDAAFVFNNEQNCIHLAEPHHPMVPSGMMASPFIPTATQPLIATFGDVRFGTTTEYLTPIANCIAPCLAIAHVDLDNSKPEAILFSHAAKQLAPALGVSTHWNDPAVRSGNLSWKYAAIEYKMLERDTLRRLLKVKDSDNCVRHLIERLSLYDGSELLVPLTYAQNPNYCQPLPCHFPFAPDWWLMNSEFLKEYPKADIIITNEISVVFDNAPSEYRIVLGYFFGVEMVEHLHLDCLWNRNVSILFIAPIDSKEYRKNLEEVVALYAQFNKLNMCPIIIESTEESHK